jgi:hypothetical protein
MGTMNETTTSTAAADESATVLHGIAFRMGQQHAVEEVLSGNYAGPADKPLSEASGRRGPSSLSICIALTGRDDYDSAEFERLADEYGDQWEAGYTAEWNDKENQAITPSTPRSTDQQYAALGRAVVSTLRERFDWDSSTLGDIGNHATEILGITFDQ